MRQKKTCRGLIWLLSLLLIVTMIGCGKQPAASGNTERSQQQNLQLISSEESAEKPTGQELQLISSASATEEASQATEEAEPSQTTDEADEPQEEPAEEPAEEVTEKPAEEPVEEPAEEPEELLDPDGSYFSKEEVALYLYQYGELPGNFITKKEARKLGWSGGSVQKYAPGKAIGGDVFGNYEGVLPDGDYHECDIDTDGKKSRGAKRIVFSDDGRIYYTDDHYETFELLYGEER